MADKVTKMVLKVDLQCPRCYKKIKKILQKFPEIRDQTFNEKENTMTITVNSYNPEKIRQKLCCKGVGIIKSVDIIEHRGPAIPNPPLKAETTGTDGSKGLGGQMEDIDIPPVTWPSGQVEDFDIPSGQVEDFDIPPRRPPPEETWPSGQVEDFDIPPRRPPPEETWPSGQVEDFDIPPRRPPPEVTWPSGQVEDFDIPPRRPSPESEPEKKKEPEKEEPEKTKVPEPILVPGYPPFYPIGVIGVCCRPWHDSYGGGPCRYHGHGRPPCYDGCGGSRPTPPCYNGCGCSCGSGCGRRRPCYDGCGCGCGGTTVFVNRCDQYLCEENPSACTVM